MRRTCSRHVGRSVRSGARIPNRNGLVIPGLLMHSDIAGISRSHLSTNVSGLSPPPQTPLPAESHRTPGAATRRFVPGAKPVGAVATLVEAWMFHAWLHL